MPRMVFDALDGAAGEETASRRNLTAFKEVCLQGRVLVNVEERSLKTRFHDKEWQIPFGVAPMGMCNLFWPGADKVLARASKHYGFPLGVSTMSSPLRTPLSKINGKSAPTASRTFGSTLIAAGALSSCRPP